MWIAWKYLLILHRPLARKCPHTKVPNTTLTVLLTKYRRCVNLYIAKICTFEQYSQQTFTISTFPSSWQNLTLWTHNQITGSVKYLFYFVNLFLFPLFLLISWNNSQSEICRYPLSNNSFIKPTTNVGKWGPSRGTRTVATITHHTSRHGLVQHWRRKRKIIVLANVILQSAICFHFCQWRIWQPRARIHHQAK